MCHPVFFPSLARCCYLTAHSFTSSPESCRRSVCHQQQQHDPKSAAAAAATSSMSWRDTTRTSTLPNHGPTGLSADGLYVYILVMCQLAIVFVGSLKEL